MLMAQAETAGWAALVEAGWGWAAGWAWAALAAVDLGWAVD